MDSSFQILFNALGFNLNGSDHSDSKEFWEIIWKIVNFLHFSWCAFLIVFQFFIHDELHSEDTGIGILSDELETLLPIFCNAVLLIETARKKSLQRKIIMTFDKIDQNINKLFLYEFNSKITRQTLIKYFILLNGTCTFVEVFILAFPKPREFLLAILLRTSSNICNRFNDFQFICYVLQIHHSLNSINRNVNKHSFSNKFRFIGIKQETRNKNLETLKGVLSEVWRASNYINLRFGFSILCTITNNFNTLIISCFFIYFRINIGNYHTIFDVIPSVSFVVPPLVNMSVIFYICWRCVEEVFH